MKVSSSTPSIGVAVEQGSHALERKNSVSKNQSKVRNRLQCFSIDPSIGEVFLVGSIVAFKSLPKSKEKRQSCRCSFEEKKYLTLRVDMCIQLLCVGKRDQ